MRPVNLIPPEDRTGKRAPLRTGVMPYAALAVLVVALAAVVMVVTTNNSIVDAKDQIALLESRQQVAEQKATALAPYAEFAALEAARTETVASLATSRFDWSRVMNELALVTPEKVWLTGLTAGAGTSTSSDGSETGSTDSPLAASVAGPSISLLGCATGQRAVADYISDLETIDGVTRVGVDNTQNAEESESGAAAGVSDSAAGGSGASCEGATSFSALIAFDEAPAPVDPAAAEAAPPAGTTETTETAQTEAAPAESGDATASASAPAEGGVR